MSSNADQITFSDSVDEQDNTVLFQDKKWTYITDSSSNGGVFTGQLQFDLNTLSSQNQWTDLSQAYIQFPVKLTLKVNDASGDSGLTGLSAITAGFKNGFHQFADSIQITLGNTTVQSSQIFQNVDTTFKILSQWSQAEFDKYGATLGLSLDDYTSATDSTNLDNVVIGTLSPVYRGVTHSLTTNPGGRDRSRFLNSNVLNTNAASAILGTNAATLGKGRVDFVGTAPTATAEVYCQFALATIRLKDVSDFISKCPLIKNTKGFIYVNYNASSTTFSTGTDGFPNAIPTSSSLYGRCTPANLYGFTATANKSYTFTAEVSGIKTSGSGMTSTPSFNNARLYAPYYVANPSIDRALSMKKKFRYLERFVTQFNVAANDNFSGTLSPGITNPKRVILYPYLTGTNAGTAGLASMSANPLLSPWDTVPATTSPFAAIQNLQLTVGGKQMWQSPVNMDYESFVQEVSQLGLDGSLNSETTQSSLLDQRKWNQLYRFYTCDVSRRMGSDDGASKSVLVSCTNACAAPMKVIAIIHYEREVVVDTSLGMIEQSL